MTNKKIGVYKITNLVNGKLYIGSSIEMGKRWRSHINNLTNGSHHSQKLQNSVNKHGITNFVFKVVELCDLENLVVREQYWIDFHRVCELGYNIRPTAENNLGFKHSDETKEKMRQRMLGNEYNKGFCHTDEFKKRKSKQMLSNTISKGNKHTDEYKIYMSQINRGKNNPNYGKSTPKDVLIERLRKVKEKGTFKGKNNPNFKFEIKYEDLERLFLSELKSTKEISDIYGCTTATINKKLRLYEIKRGRPNKYGLEINEILNYRVNKLTLNQIGELYGCSGKYISKYIKKHE
jgi:group I intron endonuclease